MFSQQTKAAKLAWLESDSKPTNGGQIGRNLFDLYPSRTPTPAEQKHSSYERDNRLARDPLAEGLLQQQPRVRSHRYQQQPEQRQQHQNRVSGSSFATNHTSESLSDEDEQDQAGSSRQLQKSSNRRLSKPNKPNGQADKATNSSNGCCWPNFASSNNKRAGLENGQQSSLVEQDQSSWCCPLIRRTLIIMSLFIIINVIVFLWPIDSRFELEPRVAAYKPRPKFEGALEINDHLDRFGEKLFEGQFHAPESMAWTSDKRAFYTGVEGGFILLVEPYADRWSVAAKLNARHQVEDQSGLVHFVSSTSGQVDSATNATSSTTKFVPFCLRDVRLYGPRAEFEPSRVQLSRCSRPLGIRLAPDGSRLYVADPLSGLYRVELAANWSQAVASRSKPLHKYNRVIKLIDFNKGNEAENQQDERVDTSNNDQDQDYQPQRPTSAGQVMFGDDIAVDFDEKHGGRADLIYLTDCSRRWSLRYLFWMLLENDDSGRVLRFDAAKHELGSMDSIVPVNSDPYSLPDARRLSFPNGLELTADKSGLLISDLNNRRILRHHLTGPRQGNTDLVMWVPGYSDNIRRGLDEPDGSATYWFACGCAIGDGKYEIAEFYNTWPGAKRWLLRWLHVVGTAIDQLGRLFDSTCLKDAGLMIDAVWLKKDPYCTHGLVAQFNEQGKVLRSLHGPSFSSNYKLLSEAHQVPLLDQDSANSIGDARQPLESSSVGSSNNRSLLYLGSVYYSFLGRVELSERQP